jgi:hypothetical protein
MKPDTTHNAMQNTLRMPLSRPREEDAFTASYVEMLNVMRRIYDLGGDPGIRDIIAKAERALGRAR